MKSPVTLQIQGLTDVSRDSLQKARFIVVFLICISLFVFTGCSRKIPPLAVNPTPSVLPQVNPDDSYCFQGSADLSNSGCYSYPGPEKLRLAWKFNAGERIRGGCAVAKDGSVIFGVLSDSLFILNSNGKEKIRISPGSWVFSSPVTGPGNLVYLGCDDGRVLCLDTGGSVRWTYLLSAESSSTPALLRDRLYIGAEDNAVHCISTDGRQLWKYSTRGRILFSSPAVDKAGNVYVGDEAGFLHQVKSDGTPGWRYNTGDEISTTSPVISGDRVIISSARKITALNSSGKTLWKRALHEEVIGNPCLSADGSLMAVPVVDGVLVILSVKDGSVKQKVKVAHTLKASAVSDSAGRIYLVGNRGPIVADWQGKIIDRLDLGKAGPFQGPPVITPRGRLIIGGMDGMLYCLGRSK